MDFLDEISSETPLPELDQTEPPAGSDRRTFLMRSALAAAMVSLTGPSDGQPSRSSPPRRRARRPAQHLRRHSIPASTSSARRAGQSRRRVEEFYKVGPGPSSSHTIGPMRITYDFYQRCTSFRPTSSARRPRSRCICSAASARPAGPRHRAGRARRHHRQGAGDDRSGLPRRSRRQSQPDLPGYAGRHTFNAIAGRHHLRRPDRATSTIPTP
jgi:hypothetical protein